MDLRLDGKHALVAGGSHGIGHAAAVELAALGANLTLLARSQESLDAAIATLPCKPGQRHASLAADMARTDELSARIQALVSADPVHIWVHNSGGPPGGRAEDAGAGAYRSAFEQHLVGGQALLEAVLPGMKGAGWGRIINIISTSVREPIANLGVSNTVRWAVAGWAKTLAGELAPHGITVNSVLPGYTRTRRLEEIITGRMQKAGLGREQVEASLLADVPAGRFGEPAEVGALVAFLASPAAAYITGTATPVDGGRTRSLG